MYIYIAENHSADFSSVLQFIEVDKVYTRNTPNELGIAASLVENFNETWPDVKLGIGRQIGSLEMKQMSQFCVKSRQVHKLRKSHGLGTGNKNLLR